MTGILIYLLGCIIVYICNTVYELCQNTNKSVKLILYDSFKISLFSWVTIIVVISCSLTYLLINIDEYITNKLE